MEHPTLGATLERLKNLFTNSYDTHSLRELLQFALGRTLAVEVSDRASLNAVVFDLMMKAKREGWLLDLAKAARDRRQERMPEWVTAVNELESVLNWGDDRPNSVDTPSTDSVRPIRLAECPPDVLMDLTRQLVAAAGSMSRGESRTISITVGDWSVRVEVDFAAFDTWGAAVGLDAIGRRVAGHRRQMDHYQKQKFGPFAVGVDFDHLIGEQKTELAAALDEMANRLRPFVRAVWRVTTPNEGK